MGRKSLVPLSIILLCLATVAQAQTIIDPSRRIDWSKAGAGTIPARTTQCGSTIAAYTGTAAIINTAIVACPAGQYVQLAAGKFTLSTGIRIARSNVTLRGAGPDQTKLVFTGPDTSCAQFASICVEDGSNNWNGAPQHLTTWTAASYAVGQTQVTVGSTAGLTVGQMVILDQANDLLDTNQVFVCDNTVADGAHTGCSSDTTYGSPGRTINGAHGNQQQYVTVTAISGNLVTFTPGLYMPNWATAKSPGMWWSATATSGVGIESLSVDGTANAGAYSNVFFDNTSKDWVKNARFIYVTGSCAAIGRNHIWIQYAAAITIRDSYFYGTCNAASLSYGIEPWQSGDLLIENNSFQHIASGVISTCAGCVIAYNFNVDDFNNNASFEFPAFWSHDAGADMALWEGNESIGLLQDDIHGSHNFGTMFRNYATGRENSKTSQTVPIILMSHSRYANVVGNVLGTSGFHNTYQASYPTKTNCDTSIYNFGFIDTDCASSGNIVSDDPLVATTLLRWGNYDTVNASVQWNASEVPSGLGQYANAVPGSHTLPSSLYLAAIPAFFATSYGAVPYPPIGPDVTSGTVPNVGGFANHIPAQVCYTHMGDDPAYVSGTVRTFNATTCYGTGATVAPAAPVGLFIQ
jgi:hypothetical protein